VHWLYATVIRPSILYGALVWWPKVTQKTTKTHLGRIQIMACLAITGIMKSTPTAAMEVLLNLTPLNLLIMAEARMALYRLHILKQPADLKTETGLPCIWENVSDPILDMRSDHTIPVYTHSKIFNVIIDMNYWRNKDPMLPKDTLIWYTDGSRTDLGTGSGIYGLKPNKRYSLISDVHVVPSNTPGYPAYHITGHCTICCKSLSLALLKMGKSLPETC
jgi:hypothetical protein